jgi:hypothetical protein
LIDASISLSVSLVALVPGLSCSQKPVAAQALRTCVDRWNQSHMVGSGAGPVNVAYRLPNAGERSRLGLTPRRLCIVAIPAGDGSWTCVQSDPSAFWCPPHKEPTGLPVRNANATLSRAGGLKLGSPPQGTHPPARLPWQRYPVVNGYIHPWTADGKLRPGLRFKGEQRGPCFLADDTVRSADSCLLPSYGREPACFPRQRPWRRGELAACSFGPGSRTYTRWVITEGSDPPVLALWGKVGGISLGEPAIQVESDYGSEPRGGYRLHGSTVSVSYRDRGVNEIRFSAPYYRTKSGFGVGSRIPPGRYWHGFVWNAWVREKPCSCWVKVGGGRRSLPATVDNFLKPWFFIYVHHGRVSGFYFARKFID